MENVQNKEHGFPKEIIDKKSYKQLDLLIKVWYFQMNNY